MASLKNSRTEENLKAAFAGESQANRRYLYFAQKADVEGHSDVSAVFRSTAEGETGHAHGHLEYLEEVGDPVTGKPIGPTADNLAAAIAGETHEYTDMYPGMARTAREEGFEEIAEWFETLAKAEKSHAGRFQRALDRLPPLPGHPPLIELNRPAAQRNRPQRAFGRRHGPARQLGEPTHTVMSVDFKTPGRKIVVGFDHPNYAHMAVLAEPARAALAKDFD